MSSRDEGARRPFVAAVGASTSVGGDAASTDAAVRGRISAFTNHPYMIDSAGEPMRVAMASWLDPDLPLVERLASLLIPAIAQALQPLERQPRQEPRLGLVLGLPPLRPGVSRDLHAEIRRRVLAAFPSRFPTIAMLDVGHAAGLVGLHAAVRKFAADDFDACVVAGVDSYLAAETLEWLEEHDQLHGAGPLNNAWGFIPGEGAGAALFVTAPWLDWLGIAPLARLLAVGRGVEPNRIKTPTVCLGEGLTAAFRESLAGLPSGAQVTDVYCDLNGEPYRADEFGFAALRTNERFVAASEFTAPADCWGDVGAASAPLALLLSVHAGQQACARGPYALVWASSETGERGAALLEIPRVERE
jgi:3-oxoacyl-[acyl-carrier-protein] synthase-1